MRCVILIVILFHICNGTLLQNAEHHWTQFKIKQNKIFSAEEDYFRFLIFKDNLMLIDKHNVKFNKGLSSYQMQINKYADLLNSEYARKVDCVIEKRPKGFEKLATIRPKLNITIPDSKDWVADGAVTYVKNQGDCGSCYAFSATGAIEGQQFITMGVLEPLSEQNLVDCSAALGNLGCVKGSPYIAMSYVFQNPGINRAVDYNYTATFNPTCSFRGDRPLAFIGGVGIVNQNDEQNLKESVYVWGPTSVMVNAGLPSFQNYGSGVYDDEECTGTLNHAMLAVGYGTENGKDFWLVKNSWGPDNFGMGGYIKMARNRNNQCGIASCAVFAIPLH